MPRVLAEIYGEAVPSTLIDFVDMKTIDRDLDLLVRHEAGPRLGDEQGDTVLLARPPTRVLVAVNPARDSPASPNSVQNETSWSVASTRLCPPVSGRQSP